MAPKPTLTIVYAPAASAALAQIFNYNADRNGFNRAVDYETFLIGRINELANDPEAGKTVAADPSFRYLVMQKRARGDGHVAGYRINAAERRVEIVAIYHTKQDWRTYLESEER